MGIILLPDGIVENVNITQQLIQSELGGKTGSIKVGDNMLLIYSAKPTDHRHNNYTSTCMMHHRVNINPKHICYKGSAFLVLIDEIICIEGVK